MPSILEDLFLGQLNPSEDDPPLSPEYAHTMRILVEKEEALTQRLSSSDLSLFNAYIDAHLDLIGQTAIHHFCVGFRLGARLQLAASEG